MLRCQFISSAATSKSALFLTSTTTTTTAAPAILSQFRFRTSGGTTSTANRGNRAPSFSSKPEHIDNPDLSQTNPFQGAKGMYSKTELNKKQQMDIEDEQFNKYYSGGNNSNSKQSSSSSQKPSSSSTPYSNSSTFVPSEGRQFGESAFGLRRRKLEREENHKNDEDAEDDIVRVKPFVRRREAQAHYHGTKPHGTAFHNTDETPDEVRAPGMVTSDQALPPAAFIRFMAFPKRYIMECIGWAPATVVSTGKYEEPPHVVAARIEEKKRVWAKMQQKDIYGGGNEWLGRAAEADPADEGILTKPKTVKQVDGETEVMGTVTLNDFIFKGGVNGIAFFLASFFIMSFFTN